MSANFPSRTPSTISGEQLPGTLGNCPGCLKPVSQKEFDTKKAAIYSKVNLYETLLSSVNSGIQPRISKTYSHVRCVPSYNLQDNGGFSLLSLSQPSTNGSAQASSLNGSGISTIAINELQQYCANQQIRIPFEVVTNTDNRVCLIQYTSTSKPMAPTDIPHHFARNTAHHNDIFYSSTLFYAPIGNQLNLSLMRIVKISMTEDPNSFKLQCRVPMGNCPNVRQYELTKSLSNPANYSEAFTQFRDHQWKRHLAPSRQLIANCPSCSTRISIDSSTLSQLHQHFKSHDSYHHKQNYRSFFTFQLVQASGSLGLDFL